MSLKCSRCISRQTHGTVPVPGSTLLRCSRRNAAARSTSEGRWAESTTTSVRSACSTLEKQSSLHFSHKPSADTRPVMMAWQVFLITVCVSMAECGSGNHNKDSREYFRRGSWNVFIWGNFSTTAWKSRCSQDTLWAIAEVKMKVKGESSCRPGVLSKGATVK